MKTIIDILNRGNLELFHSSMLAWLLDADGEHGFETSILSDLSAKLSEREWPQLEDALEGCNGNLATEVRRGGHRYDIHLQLDGQQVVFENKTKTVGNDTQLRAYQGDGVIVVALGLCLESYDQAVAKDYPIMFYSDVLNALKHANQTVPQHGPFHTLVDQYIIYLERELKIIERVRDVVTNPNRVDRADLAMAVMQDLYGENDRRFWNLILLEQYRRILTAEYPLWGGAVWRAYKNDRSGVWLAAYKGVVPFRDSLVRCKQAFNAETWFHVELYANALAAPPDDTVIGMLQLRTSVKNGTNREFAEAFYRYYEFQDNVIRHPSIRANFKSFYLVRKDLRSRELSGSQIPTALTNFALSFG